MYDFSIAFISALALLKCANLRLTMVVEKTIRDSSTDAAIYGMRITSLHFVVLHTFFVDSACKQLTMASSQAFYLLGPNNSSGDLTHGCVNNFVFILINLLIRCNVYITMVDEASCRLLIIHGAG